MNQKGFLGLILILLVVVILIISGLIFLKFNKNIPFLSSLNLANNSSSFPPNLPANYVAPTIAPQNRCQNDSDCMINYQTCTATTKSVPSDTSGNCPGKVRCMYGACALITQ